MSKLVKRLESKPIFYQFLRFASIGLLNTSFNFLILNTISKALHINEGFNFGLVEAVAFCGAVFQSYFWNRTWTFGSELNVGIKKNLQRLFVVGLLGFVAILIIIVASHLSAPWHFYLMVTVSYLIIQLAIWRAFNFHKSTFSHASHSFLGFFFVTLIGMLINVFLISVISLNLHLTGTDLDKNIAAILASLSSLVWNFIGYKVFVFKS